MKLRRTRMHCTFQGSRPDPYCDRPAHVIDGTGNPMCTRHAVRVYFTGRYWRRRRHDLRFRLLHWRRNVRWRLWDRGVVERCPECVNMGTREWFAMCDCFHAQRYLTFRNDIADLDNPGFDDDSHTGWATDDMPDEGLDAIDGPRRRRLFPPGSIIQTVGPETVLPWDEAGAGDPIDDIRQAAEDIRNAPIRPDYYTMCGARSPEDGWVCLLHPTDAAHRGGHFARAPDPSSTAAVWATTLDEWWARRP